MRWSTQVMYLLRLAANFLVALGHPHRVGTSGINQNVTWRR